MAINGILEKLMRGAVSANNNVENPKGKVFGKLGRKK